MSVVDVKVVVLENGEEVKTLSVGYFVGQEYAVKIDTADGTDRIYEGTVLREFEQLPVRRVTDQTVVMERSPLDGWRARCGQAVRRAE